jgi:hypothetical protein
MRFEGCSGTFVRMPYPDVPGWSKGRLGDRVGETPTKKCLRVKPSLNKRYRYLGWLWFTHPIVKSDRNTDTQYRALPYRVGSAGVEIMLITSRETRRWIIPKGWPIVGKKPHRIAKVEAFQEAGVKGVISKKPAELYPYSKALPDGAGAFA